MATQPSLSHKRADSGVYGTDEVSRTLATAHSFREAVSFFASERGFQAVNELAELVPRQEFEIQKRDQTIHDLNEKLVALEGEHGAYNRQQLSNFEARYNEWKEENTRLQEDVEELETTSKENESKTTTLKSQLELFQAQFKDLEAEHTQMTKKMKAKDQQLVELEARLQSAQVDMNERVKEIARNQDQMDKLQRSFDNETEQHRALKEEAREIRTRLRDMHKFSVKITKLDVPDVAVRLERLWQTATKLASDFFGCELPDHVLKGDWTRLNDESIFKHQVPLPQSNSNVARKMRAAVVLGTLTRLVNKYIFQPTYLLDEESGLRETLREQATIDPLKERYTRGILLSMFPDMQEENSENNVHLVTKELLQVASASTLLAPEATATFQKALDAFLEQCRQEWKTIQRGKQKLEPSFHYSIGTSYPWQSFQGPCPVATQDGNRLENIHATVNAEDNVVVIPRIYLVGTGDEPDPITRGCVLCKSHIDAAAEETRKSIPSAPFAQPSSARHRNRSTRTMSVSRDKTSFLA